MSGEDYWFGADGINRRIPRRKRRRKTDLNAEMFGWER